MLSAAATYKSMKYILLEDRFQSFQVQSRLKNVGLVSCI